MADPADIDRVLADGAARARAIAAPVMALGEGHRRLHPAALSAPMEEAPHRLRPRPYAEILVIVDETEECDRAIYYAAKRCARIGAMWCRDDNAPAEFENWLGVGDVMRSRGGGDVAQRSWSAPRHGRARSPGRAGMADPRGPALRRDHQADRGGPRHRRAGARRRHRYEGPGPLSRPWSARPPAPSRSRSRDSRRAQRRPYRRARLKETGAGQGSRPRKWPADEPS